MKKFRNLFIALFPKLFSIFIKLIKSAKGLKFAFAGATLASYSFLFSWKFALLIMLAIGFHESGHVWAMRKQGMKTKGFYFIPFVGGAAIAEEEYKTYKQNVYVAIMGPVWGAIMALGCIVCYLIFDSPMFAAAGAWMAALNLFNLLPISPLDGGQILRSICFSIHKSVGLIFLLISMALSILILYYLKVGLFALVLFFGGLELGLEWSQRKYKTYPDSLSKKDFILTTASYVGLVAILIGMMLGMKDIPGADLASNFFQ